MIVTVGPLPSQLLWNVNAAQPSVLACQHLKKSVRDALGRTGSKNEISFPKYLLGSSFPRIWDAPRPPVFVNKTRMWTIITDVIKQKNMLFLLSRPWEFITKNRAPDLLTHSVRCSPCNPLNSTGFKVFFSTCNFFPDLVDMRWYPGTIRLTLSPQ